MFDRKQRVLFGSPDPENTGSLRAQLQLRDIGVLSCSSSRELLELAERESPEVIVLDDRLENVGDQVLIGLLRARCPRARIILLLPPGSHPDRDREKHLDPVCSLVCPIADSDLSSVITAALRVSEQAPSKPPVILCVDDDVLFLNSLMRILRRKGYAVIGYDNPEQALEAIPLHQPALAFIDVLMPGMNGLDLVSELREEYGAALPMVLISARSTDEEIAEGYKSGARYYITKPCDPTKVLKITEYLIGKLGPAERKLLGSQL
ncbi:MAG: response regulator [Planctomycetes bacterium]|nr:response regulator [Planctomycetota bacterium]